MEGNYMMSAEHVFITQFNFKKIMPIIEDHGMKLRPIHELIEYNELVNIFNENELTQFVRLWTILENLNDSKILDIFSRIKKENEKRPEAYSSYHSDKGCVELRKDYLGYTIDSNDKLIRKLIATSVRLAFEEYTYGYTPTTPNYLDVRARSIRFDFKKNRQIIISENNEEYDIGTIPPILYNDICKIKNRYPEVLGDLFDIKPNSGVFSYEDISLNIIEMNIITLITKSIQYRNKDEFIRKKINDITFADPDRFIRIHKNDKKGIEWMSLFKEPLTQLINNYLWVKCNPNFSVEKSILENLSFRPCQRCIKSRRL